MPGASRVVIRDLGWEAAKDRVRELHGRAVKVGIVSKDAGKEYADGADLVDVAFWNEFGTETAPARPFMRHTFDEKQSDIAEVATTAAYTLLSGRAKTPAQVLGFLGQWYVKRIQDMIRRSATWAAPNAPSTLRRKKGRTPLIDTRQLLYSIDYEVER